MVDFNAALNLAQTFMESKGTEKSDSTAQNAKTGELLTKGAAIIKNLFKSENAAPSDSTKSALAKNSVFIKQQQQTGKKMPDINKALDILKNSGGFKKATPLGGYMERYTDKETGAYVGELRTDPTTGGEMFIYKSQDGSTTSALDKDGNGTFESFTKKNIDGSIEKVVDKNQDGYVDEN